jgi:hypothetical protein
MRTVVLIGAVLVGIFLLGSAVAELLGFPIHDKLYGVNSCWWVLRLRRSFGESTASLMLAAYDCIAVFLLYLLVKDARRKGE